MSRDPLFIIGVGRSGSSVFHRLLCRHPRVVWLSRLLEQWPNAAGANRALMLALNAPMVGWGLSRMIDPAECYNFWEHLAPGFTSPCRDLVAGDVHNDVRQRVQLALRRATTSRRSQLVVKVTGWPRLGFLREIFPDARFVHVLRDGRPVAASFLKVDWWRGWRGPSGWLFGDLTPEQAAEWRQFDRSFVALAGIQWKILMDAMEKAKNEAPASCVLEIKYEDLCREPVVHFRHVAEFAGLSWMPNFERKIRAASLRCENEKWRSDLTADQQAILESVLRSHLVRYGYERRGAGEPVNPRVSSVQGGLLLRGGS